MKLRESLTLRSRFVASLVLGSVILAAVGLGLQVRHLQTTWELTRFMLEGDPRLQEDELLRAQFKLPSDSPVLVLIGSSSSWLSTSELEWLEARHVEVSEIEGIHRVHSVAGLIVQGKVKGEDIVGPWSQVIPESERDRHRHRSSLITPTLLSEDAKWANMLLEVDGEVWPAARLSELEARLRSVLSSDRHDVQIGGVSVLQNQMSSLLGRELLGLSALGLGLSLVALILMFKTWSSLFGAALAVGVSNAVILGLLSLVGGTLDVLGLSLPILIAVETMALFSHTAFKYREVRQTDMNPWDAMVVVWKKHWLASLMVAITTSVGFLTLIPSSAPALRDFGMLVAVASVGLWFTTMAVCLPFLLLAPVPEPRAWIQRPSRWPGWIVAFRKPILIGTLFGAVLVLPLLPFLSFEHRLFGDVPKGEPAGFATALADQVMGGTLPVELSLTRQHGDWMSAEGLQWLRGFQSAANQAMGPQVGMSASALDALELVVRDGDFDEARTLMEIGAGDALRSFLMDSGRTTRVSLRLRDREGEEIRRVLGSLRTYVAQHGVAAGVQSVELSFGGWASYIHDMNQKLAQSLVGGFWQALLLITVIVGFVLRSFRLAMIAVLPNIIPALVLLGILALSGTPVTPGLAIVFSIALGLAFNNTIYLLVHLRETSGDRWTRADVIRAFQTEARPCLLATLPLVAGFAVLMLSQFQVTMFFGGAMVISILAGLYGDLVLLPALLGAASRDPEAQSSARVGEVGAGAHAAGWILVGVMALGLANPAVANSSGAAGVSHSGPVSLKEFSAKALSRIQSRDERMKLRMRTSTPGESDEVEVRELELSRTQAGSGEQKLAAKVSSPSKWKGTGLLVVTDGETESKWIYLPSSKQVRRVMGGGEGGSILGSELHSGDFDLGLIDDARAKLIRADKDVVVVESEIRNKESPYRRCVATFERARALLLEAECVDGSGRPVKRLSVKKYREIKSGIFRPEMMRIENLRTRRATDLEFLAVRVNLGLKASEFTPESLAR